MTANNKPQKIRLVFSKTDSAKYISHLDLMRTMRRAFLRAGIGLKYTEGFNPHPYISVALPLPVGCGSVCELLDFEPADNISPDIIPALMRNTLPDGIIITEAYYPGRKFNEIAWVEIRGEMIYDNGVPSGIEGVLGGYFSSGSIIIRKKTKHGETELDIAPHIKNIEFQNGDREKVILTARLSAQNPSLNPESLMSALRRDLHAAAPDFASFCRVEVFDRELNAFR